MHKFKHGDRVRIKKDSKFYGEGRSNPKDTTGTLEIRLDDDHYSDFVYRVYWDDDSNNTYREEDLEFEKEYEDKWELNDGKVTIPSDADTLTKDGSVVAFRRVKRKPFKVGDRVKKKDNTSLNKRFGLVCGLLSCDQIQVCYYLEEEFGVDFSASFMGNFHSSEWEEWNPE